MGTIVGVLISMVMVAPRSWRNAIYRALCSVPAGFIFAPAMPRLLWFLQGDDWDMRMAAACAAG
ncbi:MAG: hypothetical protein P4L83_02225, partial [Nevskia sp.]|nr:hypothetical protein [Nevskia sp.]